MDTERQDALCQAANQYFQEGRLDQYVEVLEELRGMPDWAEWCAAAAYLAWSQQRPEAADLLAEALKDGFTSPNFLPLDLSQRPDWPALQAGLTPPRVRLLDWPEAPMRAPLELETLIASRLEAFRAYLPPAEPSAWDTAQRLLMWTHTQWPHDGDHDSGDADALELLERSARGEHFRCVEFGRLLAAALNARDIPARKAALRTQVHHTGRGQGHVATEAWIDELGKWVLLDPQNGGYWTREGQPQDAHELCSRYWQRASPLPFQALATPLTPYETHVWWQYFARVQCGQGLWVPPGQAVSPMFQDVFIITAERVTHEAPSLWPDLSAVQLGFARHGGQSALRLWSPHPYVTAFELESTTVSGNPGTTPLEQFAGLNSLSLRALTRFGPLSAHTVRLDWPQAFTPSSRP